MGHGDRWDAVAGDAQEAVSRLIPDVLRNGHAIGGPTRKFVWPADGSEPEQTETAAPLGVVLRQDPFVLCTISLRRPSDKSLVLMSAYPAPLRGISRCLKVTAVEEDCLGLEAWIHAETAGGVPLIFFAADYFVHPGRYYAGAEIEASIAAIAYGLATAYTKDAVIDDPAAVARLRALGFALEDDGSIRIVTRGAAILLPKRDWEPSDFEFQGTIKSMETVAGSRRFHAMTVTVVRDGGEDIDVMIFANSNIPGSPPPDPGQDVAGDMCLMGWLADFRWEDAAHGFDRRRRA